MNVRQFDLNLLVALDVLLTERSLLVRVGRNLELTAHAAELVAPVHECVR